MNHELYHYGIKGQKWGVRNGPPYPLTESKKSNREKRIKKTMNKSIGDSGDILKVSAITLSVTTAYTALLAGAIRLSARHNMVRERDKHLETNKAEIKQIKKPHSEEQDQEAINKVGYDSNKPEYRMNCTMCTTAYDLRRRGYDVKAETSFFGRTEKDVVSWYKNTTKNDFRKTKSYSELKTMFKNQPDGSRGNLITGVGPYDSKHSMVWEKKNGKVVIRDCQSNKIYTNIDESIIRQKSRHGYQVLRTDNREINWETIRDAVMPK